MVILKILAAGAIAGIVANATGYVITGRLFHPYQAKTPNTWRATESWTHYQDATAVRIDPASWVRPLMSNVRQPVGS